MTINELLERHPLPWKYVVDNTHHMSMDEGKIVSSNGSTVCMFGDSETYYPTSGSPPENDVLDLLLSLVNGLKPSV